MLRRLQRLLAPRAKNHEALVKMWKEGPPPVTEVSSESRLHFRDTRPPPINESDEFKRRRLLFQSGYRGMVEMDIILGVFARQYIHNMSGSALEEYDTLLRHFDNDLFKWLVMGETAPASVTALSTFNKLQQFVLEERDKLLGHIV